MPRSFGYLSTLWARDVQPEGVKVEYKYFPVFTDMLAALNGGKIDLTEIGDVGAVQSYVNGGERPAVAVTEPNDENVRAPRPQGQPGPSFADLKGKKIAFLRSTNSYTGFLHQIKEAGLEESDFQIVEISGPTATRPSRRPARRATTPSTRTSPTWSRRRAAVSSVTRARFAENLYPYLATRKPSRTRRRRSGGHGGGRRPFPWIKANPEEQAKLLAPKLGFSESAITTTYARGAQGLQKIDQTFWDHEQPVIDELVDAGIVAKPVKAQDVFIPTFDDYITPQPAGGS